MGSCVADARENCKCLRVETSVRRFAAASARCLHTSCDHRFRHTYIPVCQSISERILRLSFHVAVGSACHAVIGELREFVQTLVECHRKLAGRRYLSEQHLRSCFAALCTRIPQLQYRIEMFRCIGKINVAARHQAKDHRLAGLLYCLHQISLYLRKLKIHLVTGCVAVACIALLTFERLIKANAKYNHITVVRHDLRLRKTVCRECQILGAVTEKLAADTSQHAHVLSKVILKSFEYRHIAACRSVIISHECGSAVGIRPDHTDRPDL